RLARQALLEEQLVQGASAPLPRAFVAVHVVQPLDELPGGCARVVLPLQAAGLAQVFFEIDEGVEPVVPLDHRRTSRWFVLALGGGGWTSFISLRMRSAAAACCWPPRSAAS